MAGLLGGTGVISGADLSQAVIKEKYNVVTLAPNQAGAAHPAPEGTVIRDEGVVRTGTDSRAGIEFTDLTLARLGANSIFSFDAKARAMNAAKGAVLFSKPTNSGPIQIQAGAISGAITGSTGFASTVAIEGLGPVGHLPSKGKGTTTLLGMLEGKFVGGTRWTDSAGREHNSPFRLGPGEMVIARPDGAPRLAQFDIPRFLRTSPLVKNFRGPLPNEAALARAVADFEADDRAGFVDRSNIMVSNKPRNLALVGRIVPPDVAAQIRNQPGGFLPGITGVIRAQLIWNTAADLDLYLTLPTGQVVSFGNVSVVFNNGRATARLDRDNNGGTINFPPNTRVENIVVNGIPLAGIYRFMVNNFNSTNPSDFFTLRVFYNGRLQLVTGSLAAGQNSVPVVVQVPRP
ncbi:MAG TPA: FecR domain-containing protein [Chthoniobacterales bacterium]|nr:FecR domain-containing protein [Chthoniobacterales bacterium]